MSNPPVDASPVSNFETNSGSFGARRKAAPRRAAARNTARARRGIVLPTPERMAKGDLRAGGGDIYTAADPALDAVRSLRESGDALVRLARGGGLSRDEATAARYYHVAETYQRLVHVAGLDGISAQNLLGSGGGGDPAHMMPTSEAAAAARQRLRNAWAILGREQSGVVHGILIEGIRVERFGSDEYAALPAQQASGKTKLRLALWQLVAARWA